MLGAVSLFWLMIVCAAFFFDGGFAVIGPYMAEVWPTPLRVSGMGSAYGVGGIGKIVGPAGLALMIGATDVVRPQVSAAAIRPAFLYFAAWMALCGLAFLLFGFETARRPLDELDARDVATAAEGSSP
jgi:putative MFS transporter